jgi:pimeloyl-ACP methyl ester carboxylesterase
MMTGSNNQPSVVLVHGGFVDGSGWQSVYRLLRDDGYAVGVVQNPTLSLDGDVAAARLIIDEQDAPVPPILPPRDGLLLLDRDKFHASFASDVPADVAEGMADSQVPSRVDALGGTITDPAWRTKPSWYLLATEDRIIPPPAQRMMAERAGATVVEVAASHAVFFSHPEAVAGLIRTALEEEYQLRLMAFESRPAAIQARGDLS